MAYLPVAVPSGNFTPGALATLEFSAALINATWEQANIKYSDFESKISNLGSWLNPATHPTMSPSSTTAPTVTEPTVNIPSSVSTSTIISDFDTEYQSIVNYLLGKFTAFQSTYFPNDATTYSALESWISSALANPTVALPASVAAQIWGDDQARILSDKTRAQDTVLQTFAARRYPLPPGAAASAVIQLEQKAQDAMAESSRKIAVMSVEQMRFVVEQAKSLRHEAMDDAVKYITALTSGPDAASKVVGIGYDAQSKLISSAAQFYNARTEAKRLISSVDQHNSDLAQDAAKENLKSELTIIEDKLRALLEEARAISSMAASMFNNLHASAGTSYQVNT